MLVTHTNFTHTLVTHTHFTHTLITHMMVTAHNNKMRAKPWQNPPEAQDARNSSRHSENVPTATQLWSTCWAMKAIQAPHN